jgi:hypothetical protein
MPEEIDLREKLAHIDQMLAQHERDLVEAQRARLDMSRIEAERDRSRAEIPRIEAERERRLQELRYQPILALIAGLTAGAALLAAGTALGAFLTRLAGG